MYIERGFLQNTDPLLTPYKINGKMKIEEIPELSVGPIQVRQ